MDAQGNLKGRGDGGPRKAGRAAWLAVAATLAVLGAVGTLAFHAARRDRGALVAAFGDEHLFRLRIAVREIESELAAVRQHLDFAARLVGSAETGDDPRKELEALLEVVRSYRAIAVYDASGRQRALALDSAASSGSTSPWSEALAQTARAAIARREMAISPPLGDPSAPWYRAFATPLVRNGGPGGAVVILVDQKHSFERLRVVAPESSARMLLLGPHGRPAPLTDPSLGAAADLGGRFGEVLGRMRAGDTGTALLPAAEATALGMGGAEAVVVFAPIRTHDAGHWSVAVVDSTAGLHAQEHAIIVRMAVLAAIFALALGALSVYLIVSAKRSIAVQERLKTAEHLLRAEKLATVGVLAAGIAHEIGTPLGVVRGRAEMLAAKAGPTGAQSEGARIIVEEIDRISRTIQELLDFSRVSPAATAASVSLGDVAAKVVELLAFEARTRKIGVSVEIAGVPPLAANPDQLKQVLVNLLLNALHACSAGGHVALRARTDAQRRSAVVEVVDDGAGIPDALRHRVFDPFFTTKKRGKGTGLGLTVAAQIVQNHGGEIDLDSVVGKGTRVVVSWPLASRGVEDLDGREEGRAHSGGR